MLNDNQLQTLVKGTQEKSLMTDWVKLAANLLKAELKRKGISNKDLIVLLKNIGVEETRGGLVNKINRGTFQFSFFLQCAHVIGLKQIRFDE
jgi:hypothetical protein